MVYIKTNITQELYEELRSKGEQATKDFGFEYLYKKGYIETDKEYKGCFLHRNGNCCEIILATYKYN